MSGKIQPLEPGLYLVSTPIGNARDITLRALDILGAADVLAAEDTRSLRHLMDIHGIPTAGRTILSYHDHNGERMRPRLLEELAEGRSLAYASEAGTPLVADPGFQLARAAISHGHKVTAAPGPSAAIAALTVSGMPSDRFLFAGFPPSQSGQRKRWLAELADIPATLVLYESPRRINALFSDLLQTLGPDRSAVICRELTKRFEEVLRGTIGVLAEQVAGRPLKGEIVVLIDRAGHKAASEDELEAALREALECHSIRESVSLVSQALGLPRRRVYQAALALGKDA